MSAKTDLKGIIRVSLRASERWIATLKTGAGDEAPRAARGLTKIRGGRSFERLTDRRREQGDGPLSFDRRLARRRGVSDSVGCDREEGSRGAARFRSARLNCWIDPAPPAFQKRGGPGLARLSLVSAIARSCAGSEARRRTASSALTRASSAASADLAIERSAALAGSGWASSAAMRFVIAVSAGVRSSSALRRRAFSAAARWRFKGA